MAEAKQREIVPGRSSVTEHTGNNLKQVHLKRHFNYYIDPLKSIFMVNGTAVHSIIEEGHALIIDKENFRSEESFEEEIIPGYVLTGKPDHWDGPLLTLWDHKNVKRLDVVRAKKDAEQNLPWLSNDKFAQMNVYKVFKYTKAEHLKLSMMCQGWERKVQESGRWVPNPIKQIEVVEVPIAPESEVRLWVKNRMIQFKEMEETGKVPECPRADYMKYGSDADMDNLPRKCFYCEGRTNCDQFAAMKSKAGVK